MGREIKVKSSMDIERAASYLIQLAASLTAGSLTVQKGEEYIVLKPTSPVWVEVEAEQGKSKETFSLEVEWSSAEAHRDADELVISLEPPVVSEQPDAEGGEASEPAADTAENVEVAEAVDTVTGDEAQTSEGRKPCRASHE